MWCDLKKFWCWTYCCIFLQTCSVRSVSYSKFCLLIKVLHWQLPLRSINSLISKRKNKKKGTFTWGKELLYNLRVNMYTKKDYCYYNTYILLLVFWYCKFQSKDVAVKWFTHGFMLVCAVWCSLSVALLLRQTKQCPRRCVWWTSVMGHHMKLFMPTSAMLCPHTSSLTSKRRAKQKGKSNRVVLFLLHSVLFICQSLQFNMSVIFIKVNKMINE